MNEKDPERSDEEPAPTKDSDANRVTSEETERAEEGRATDSDEGSQE